MSRLVKLEISNFKKIGYVILDVDPEGNMITVGGLNGEGKTSLLDAIASLYGGKSAMPEVPVKQGEKNGFIKGTEDTGVVTKRTFTETGGGGLTVRTARGLPVDGGAQAACDSKLAPIHFDPLEFSRMKPKPQLDLVRQLVGLDFTELDAKRAGAFSERTMVNRDVKNLEAQLGSPQFAGCEDAPDEAVDVSELMAQLTKIREGNALVDQAHAIVNGNEAEIITINSQIAQLNQKAQALKKTIDQWKPHTVMEKQDTSAVEIQINQAGETNRLVMQKQQQAQIVSQLATAKQNAEALTATITKADADKKEQMGSAVFPVPGMSFDDSVVLFNDIPFEQCSSAERLRMSSEVGVALCSDPEKLQVMLIRDGSLLDDNSLALLAQMAHSKGVQCFLEIVGNSGNIVIEDGEAKS